MIRLFQIEWIKLRSYRSFKILLLLYILVVILVCCSGMFFLKYLRDKGVEFRGIDPTMLPIYHFPDIWQNITQVASFLKIILAFIIIISITNEVTFKTLRQNIIDGLNRTEFILSKVLMITVFSIANSLLVLILGLTLGIIHSPQVNLELIFSGMEFLGGFFLTTFVYLLFAFVVGIIIKRTGIAIVFFGIYAPFIEMFAALIFTHAPKLPPYFKTLARFFPVEAVNNIIRSPFEKYAFQEIQDYIAFNDVAIVLLHITLFLSFIFLMLKRKNL